MIHAIWGLSLKLVCLQRVEDELGGRLGEEVSVFHVRSVAPNKEMSCISFRLPRSVAFALSS